MKSSKKNVVKSLPRKFREVNIFMIDEKQTKRKKTKSEIVAKREKTISFIILFIVSVIWAIPLLYMLGTSFKSDYDLQVHPERFFPSAPSEWTLKHYTGFFVRNGSIDKMPIWILNSLWSSVFNVFLVVAIDLITAYAFVFLKFKSKKYLIGMLLLWMAVPSVIGNAPAFALYSQIRNSLKLNENPTLLYFYIYMWILVPSGAGVFNMLLMRSYFMSIPKEIIESAKSDGATNMQIFRRIVCPLAKSTTLLIVLFVFKGSWNNLVFPQLLLTGENEFWKTITVALTAYTGGSGWDATGVAMATSVFATIPILIVFCITQNKMIDGLATTGVKG